MAARQCWRSSDRTGDSMLSFRIDDSDRSIHIDCDNRGMAILVDALERARASGAHVHLLTPSNGGRELDARTPWGSEATGEVVIRAAIEPAARRLPSRIAPREPTLAPALSQARRGARGSMAERAGSAMRRPAPLPDPPTPAGAIPLSKAKTVAAQPGAIPAVPPSAAAASSRRTRRPTMRCLARPAE